MKLYETTLEMIKIKHPSGLNKSEDWAEDQTDNDWHRKQIWWYGEIGEKTYVSMSDGYLKDYNAENDDAFTKSDSKGVTSVKSNAHTTLDDDQVKYFLDVS